jgi:toxin-antitoxin system PIN domain toxin
VSAADRVALLDANVLIALLDADHVHHARAEEWLSANVEHGWASCAITQMGAARILSNPRYPADLSARAALQWVAAAVATPHHVMWPCDIAPTDETCLDPMNILRHTQITDTYLLALAVRHGGRLVTFDRGISLGTAPGAEPDQLLVLLP